MKDTKPRIPGLAFQGETYETKAFPQPKKNHWCTGYSSGWQHPVSTLTHSEKRARVYVCACLLANMACQCSTACWRALVSCSMCGGTDGLPTLPAPVHTRELHRESVRAASTACTSAHL